ncbi:MAG TPA: c-type cytochrome domain-containing protein [Gemmataceae bacterium]|nr:c-type cytochrome domain-containing protein [Gemmataceae bacterium]
MTKVVPLAVAVFLLAAAALPARAADEPKKEPDQVSYYRDIRPLFVVHCQGCHQPAKPQGGYVMTSHADLLKKGDSAKPSVVAGKPEQSHLIEQITPQGGKAAMPKGKPPLSARDINLIKKWIAQGARDDTPASARAVIDMEHPPKYALPPVITALAFSPDGKLLAVSGHHETLIHNADGSGLVARLVGLSERIQSLAFSPDGKLLAMAGGSPWRFGEVQVWDVAAKKLKLSATSTFDTLYGVSWSPDGSKIAFGCADNNVRAIDTATGKQVVQMGTHTDWVLGTCFSRDGNYIVSVSRDRSMKLTEVATERFIDNITSITPGALKGGLMAVARRPRSDNRMQKVPPDTPKAKPKPYDEVLCGGSDGTPRLYMIHREKKRVIGDDFNKVKDYEPMPGRICAVAFSPDGSLGAAGSSLGGTGEVRVFGIDDGKRVAKFDSTGPVYALAWHPDGKTVAVGGFDGTVRLYEARTGKLVRQFVPVPLNGASTAVK